MPPLPLIPLLLGLELALSGNAPASAAVLQVPAEFPTIQAAVDAAADEDVIAIAPGTYVEDVSIVGKNLTLLGDPADPGATVVEAAPVEEVDDNDTPDDPTDDVTRLVPGIAIEVQRLKPRDQPPKTSHVVLRGLTVRNGASGVTVRPDTLVEFDDCRAIENKDGFSLEGRPNAETHGLARGIVRRSVLERNTDDGVDSDSRSELWIEDSTIQDNGDDGIEIRLEDKDHVFGDGELMRYVILRNRFLRNGEDGLQLIDGETLTPRSFRIERNVFANNTDAGLGMMCHQVTNESFEGCPLDEPVELVHNSFIGNHHGLTGGANLMGVNNLFVGHVKGVKNVVSPSLLSNSLLHDNATDALRSELVATVTGDPRLTATYELSPGSAALDAGARLFPATGEPILDVGPCDFRGRAPDVGAFELDTGSAVIGAFDVPLTAGGDDAFEKRGKVRLADKRLDLGKGGVAAFRFAGVAIEPGAEVLTAEIQLSSAKKSTKSAALRIWGEASDDASPWSGAVGELSGRPKTAAAGSWSPPPWADKGAASPEQRTPNLAALVQEIVDRPGWASGHALAFLVSGGGKRSVAAREGGPAARLHIELGASGAACARAD